MKPTLEKLWNGGIAPYESCGVNDPEILNIIDLMKTNKEALEKELNQQQMSALEKYLACYDEYDYLLTVHAFCSGFSLASKLLTEALQQDI